MLNTRLPLLHPQSLHSFSPLLTNTSSHRGFLGGPGTYTSCSCWKTLNLPFLTWNIYFTQFFMVFTTLYKLTNSSPKPKVYLCICSPPPFSIPILLLELLFSACLFLFASLSNLKFHAWGNRLFLPPLFLSIFNNFRHVVVFGTYLAFCNYLLNG